MKTYRVKGYETVMYYVDIKAQNKHDAYTKAMDVNVLDWEQQNTIGLWDNGGFKINKKDIEEIKSNVIKIKTWTEGYNEWKKSKSK
tara:strand:+ start:307 stop:564 length:258 start_codon:yes stop_codon:yes gene_type:complete